MNAHQIIHTKGNDIVFAKSKKKAKKTFLRWFKGIIKKSEIIEINSFKNKKKSIAPTTDF